MRMPFGKYQGQSVYDIPIDYIYWLKNNASLFGELEDIVDERIEKAEQEQYEEAQRENSQLVTAFEMGLLKTIYRRIAMKWHPDQGGSTQAMPAVNEFYDELRVAVQGPTMGLNFKD